MNSTQDDQGNVTVNRNNPIDLTKILNDLTIENKNFFIDYILNQESFRKIIFDKINNNSTYKDELDNI